MDVINPKVSVIIPVYNGELYIKRALDSVLAQTYPEIEIIIIDDGSQDHTKSIISSYLLYPSIKYFYQENSGLSSARNAGIREATGKYLKFLDCDDILYPKQIELQVRHLEAKSGIISITDHHVIFPDGKERTVYENLDKENQLGRLIVANFIPVHSVLIEKVHVQLAGNFDVGLTALEDADLWLRLLLKGLRFERVDYVGCCYYIQKNSLSADCHKMFYMKCRVLEKFNSLVGTNLSQIDRAIGKSLLRSNTRLIEGCLARRLDPQKLLLITIQTSRTLCMQNKKGIRKLFFKLLGFKLYVFLKFNFDCLRSSEYKSSLLNEEIRWRNSDV